VLAGLAAKSLRKALARASLFARIRPTCALIRPPVGTPPWTFDSQSRDGRRLYTA
jgi:hypothetical protein